MTLSELDREVLFAAVCRLERQSFVSRIAALAGRPVGLVSHALPARASALVAEATALALERALDIALFSLRESPPAVSRMRGRVFHSVLACASGGIGGAFGLPALAIELPVSTAIMLRAIAAIAQSEGEDLADPRAGLACLEVLALGAASASGGGPDEDYFAVRDRLAPGAVEVADFAVDKTAVRESAPAIVRFVAQIAARFGIVVSEKAMAQAVSVVGALGGAAVNLAFIEHFQDLARGHFTVRRLERVYGSDAVRAEYGRLKAGIAAVKSNSRIPARQGDAPSAAVTAAPE
jgi:EcsC protein family